LTGKANFGVMAVSTTAVGSRRWADASGTCLPAGSRISGLPRRAGPRARGRTCGPASAREQDGWPTV